MLDSVAPGSPECVCLAQGTPHVRACCNKLDSASCVWEQLCQQTASTTDMHSSCSMLTAFVIFAGLQALGQTRQLGRQLSTKTTVTSWLPRWEARSLPPRSFLRPEDEPLQATFQGAVILHTALKHVRSVWPACSAHTYSMHLACAYCVAPQHKLSYSYACR